MKNKLFGFLPLLLCILLIFAACGAPPADIDTITLEPGYDYTRFMGQDISINVYNWGEYIANGADGSLDVNAAFEEITGIKVNYTNFAHNEEMHTKISSQSANYDVIIPSDYMIGRMINEELLLPLNFDNIPNYKKIGEQYKNLEYDPQNLYSVPYTWGYVGIIYNTDMINKTVDSWDILWDEDYSGEILMFENSRDAFAIASLRLGLSINPSSAEEIEQAAKMLKQQNPLVQTYVMDQIFDKMEGNEAAVAPYYAGDALMMLEKNDALAFAVPKEGTNYFVDAMCIPTSCQNKEAAEMYINFMCETDIAVENSLAIGYSTPQLNAEAAMPAEIRDNPIAYPSADILANTEVFNVMPEELAELMDTEWNNIRASAQDGGTWIILALLILAVIVSVLMLWRGRVKRKRNEY